ncbi:luciferase family protein [Paenibacillus woosongensis]|uniref:luciferase family protein n=1 Tax=Paenibacillus woosongensis TaxID=307580 RepID=UPI0039B6FEEB
MSVNRGERLTEELLSWAEVTIHPHRFGGVELQYNNKEIGHQLAIRVFEHRVGCCSCD